MCAGLKGSKGGAVLVAQVDQAHPSGLEGNRVEPQAPALSHVRAPSRSAM
jgi:hypothetical protein